VAWESAVGAGEGGYIMLFILHYIIIYYIMLYTSRASAAGQAVSMSLWPAATRRHGPLTHGAARAGPSGAAARAAFRCLVGDGATGSARADDTA
jgi:hypothetical protein